MSLRVVKIGGSAVEDVAQLQAIASAIAKGPATLVVHGGGREVSDLQRLLGAEPEWRDGLRYTSPAALRAAAMALSGAINKRVVGALIAAGADALGLSGEDASLLRARTLAGGALGRTGEVVDVRTELLGMLLAVRITPVVSPVSRGEDGAALNVNADQAAAAIAAAMGASELLLVSDVPGVISNGQILAELEATEIEPMIASGTASGGMQPKLRAALAAVAAGVACVRIGGPEAIEVAEAGTRIRDLRVPLAA